MRRKRLQDLAAEFTDNFVYAVRDWPYMQSIILKRLLSYAQHIVKNNTLIPPVKSLLYTHMPKIAARQLKEVGLFPEERRRFAESLIDIYEERVEPIAIEIERAAITFKEPDMEYEIKNFPSLTLANYL